MIFYYTGTGNSLEAATILAEYDETLVDMGACAPEGPLFFEVPEGERVGFCFPVYYGGLPIPVQRFLDRWELSRKPDFIFAVLTCGSTTFAATEMLSKRLAEKGMDYNSAYAVKMPDNYVVMYELSSKAEQEHVLEEARTRLKMIRGELREGKEMDIVVDGKDRNATRMMYLLYKKGKKTAKFRVTDSCTGCGQCVKYCQEHCIELVNRKPTWVNERCSHCMSCMRCNAIQYGGRSEGRARYTNPILKRKSLPNKKG